MKHKCSVCWAEQTNHKDWFEHATEVHSASLEEFGMRICAGPRVRPTDIECLGITHGKRLRSEGTVRPRVRPEPQPFTARDGTVYTPVPLPLDEA